MPTVYRFVRGLLISSLIFLAGFIYLTLNASSIYAQSCSCTVNVSNDFCDPSGGVGGFGAVCVHQRDNRTVSGTVSGGRCEYFTTSSSCSINSSGDCVLNAGSQPGSCTCTSPTSPPSGTPQPTAPPASGDECWDNGGVCMTGANCGEFGLADTSYTCSDGQPLCCVPVSGGGGGGGGGTDCGEWSCDMQWRVPSLMYVGLNYPTVAFPNWDDDAHDQSFYKMTFDTENYFVA